MDVSLFRPYTLAVLIPTLLFTSASIKAIKFYTRISPTIPYAGEKSFYDRLQVPVQYSKDPAEFLRKARKELGNVFCVDLFAAKIVFVLGPEGNKEVMKAAEEKLNFAAQLRWALGPIASIILDTPNFLPLATKDVRAYLMKQSTLDYFTEECRVLTEEHFFSWSKKGSVPLFKSFSHLVIAYMIVLMTGIEFYRMHGEELIPLMAQFERDLQNPILRIVPRSMWRLTTPGARLFSTLARFDTLLATELANIRAHPEKHVGRFDYFAHLIAMPGLGDREDYERCFGCHIMFMIFAGHANAAMTIPWLYLHARRVPSALDRLREEALLPQEERKPYLEACLRETGRLYTNTTVMRMTTKTVEVAGHVIPAGTLVAASPLATQRADLEHDTGGIFSHAGTWNPMRFLGDPVSPNHEEAAKPEANAHAHWFQRAEFVQFGLGVHSCAGEKLARLIIFDMVLRSWMEQYELEVTEGLEEDVKGVDGVGVEAAWTEENFGTPSVRGTDPRISVKRRIH